MSQKKKSNGQTSIRKDLRKTLTKNIVAPPGIIEMNVAAGEAQTVPLPDAVVLVDLTQRIAAIAVETGIMQINKTNITLNHNHHVQIITEMHNPVMPKQSKKNNLEFQHQSHLSQSQKVPGDRALLLLRLINQM